MGEKLKLEERNNQNVATNQRSGSRSFFSWINTAKNAAEEESLAGSFLHKGKKFVHYTDLKKEETALYILGTKQKAVLALVFMVLGLGLFFNWHATLITVFAFLTLVYFADLLFSIFLIYRTFKHSPEIKVTDKELKKLSTETLPTYTIFCPLYHEWQVVPQFIEAMSKIDYPKEKLQILLLLEEDDFETVNKIRSMALPETFSVLVVPHSLPKTKPKALNFALSHAKGEYLVVYDAEDIPQPQQLKKAVVAFRKAGEKIICIQAKLNYYNPKQNLLTKLFTAEYSLWFDLILPGLQSIGAPIPLGGTSNHFKTVDLKKLKGWDAFNVTEDCDLGMRLSKQGYQTAIVDSVTLEEANSNFKNWLNQRSRWIKGYIQTYLVHMREPSVDFKGWSNKGLLGMQFIVGAKVLSMFVNPFLWVITACYFLLRSQVGVFIESFFPGPILYLGVPSLVFGNFLYLYYYMIGLAKRNSNGLIKYTFLVPFYWLGMSMAAWKAVYEIVVKPHYWAKTVHGLHLFSKNAAVFSSLVKEKSIPHTSATALTAETKGGQDLWSYKNLSSGSVLIIASVAGNFLNFLFNAFASRAFTVEQIGLLTLFNTFAMLVGIVMSALSYSINHKTAYLEAKKGKDKATSFFTSVQRKTVFYAFLASLVWVSLTPVLAKFFHLQHTVFLLSFAPVIFFGLLMAVKKGFLHGKFSFLSVAAIVATEAAAKLLFAFGFFKFAGAPWAILCIPLSVFSAWLLAAALARKEQALPRLPQAAPKFPLKFFGGALLSGLSTATFLSVDVILAKHYLSAAQAGEYALLSLVGKMIFFFGSLLGGFVVTFISHDEGENKSSTKTFYRLFLATAVLSLLAFVPLGPLGKFFVPLLLGEKTLSILPFLNMYGLAIVFFTLSGSLITYHLSRKQYSFVFVSLASCLALIFGIVLDHSSLKSIVDVLFLVSLAHFVVLAVVHFFVRSGKFILANVIDLVDVLFPLPNSSANIPGKRILIFNWRDTRHVYAGGAEIYVQELSQRWVAEGHSVTIFCGNDSKSPRNEVIDGVNIVRRGGFYFVYVWAFLYYLVKFRGRFDYIIDCQNGIPFFTPLYAKEPVFCLMHHVHQEVFLKYLVKPLAVLATVLEKKVMPWVYRKTKFITISESSKKAMLALGLGREGIEIVSPGVDLELLKPGEKHHNPVILYLGRLKAYKSVDVLIKAFSRIAEMLPKARLVIAGSGEEQGNLKEQAAALGLSKQVIFTGKVTEEQKLNWLQKAWVFVNPSLMEGWGITTIEANACGVPVVAADVPGLRDSVRNPHTGYLVPYGDDKKFAQKILDLILNKDLYQEMSNNSVKWAKQFNWYNSSRQFLKKITQKVKPASKVFGKLLNPGSFFSVKQGVKQNQRVLENFPSLKIGPFKLVSVFAKQSSYQRFKLWLYEDKKGRKAIAKQWLGKNKDASYYSLMNEIRFHQCFKDFKAKNARELQNNFSNIAVPKLLATVFQERQLLLLTEFSEGQSISKFSPQRQMQIYEDLQNFFAFLSSHQTFFKGKLPKHSTVKILGAFPFVWLKSILKYPKIFPLAISGFWQFVSSSLKLIGHKEIGLVHRDLTEQNVLVSGDKISILDFELAALSSPILENVQIAIGSTENQNFLEDFYRTPSMENILANKEQFSVYKALAIFSSLQHISDGKKDEFEGYYKFLKNSINLKPTVSDSEVKPLNKYAKTYD